MQDSNRKRRPSSPPLDPTPACNKCRSRKIRCDRAQPECSSCRRANIPCDFSASFKRTNPAKQLLRDFSSVAERLNDIDRSLARLSQQVESLTRTAPQSLFASSTADDGDDESSSLPADGAIPAEGGSGDVAARSVLVTNGGGEQLHAYPAALCLFRASHKLLGAALGKLETGHTKTLQLQGPLAAAGQNPSLGQALSCHYETFPFRQKCTEPPITSDQLPISYPAQEVLYSLLDRYLGHINVHVPVFEASSIYASIETCYRADSADRNPAWAVCFHGIILLASNLDSLVGQRAGFKTHSSEKTPDTISTNIMNCRRALANLDALSQPTLIHIQAFITLTLVAREFFLSSVYEKVCHAACALARTMGLSRSVSGMNEQTAQTRQRLFWILYALDKQRVFLSGQAPDMYMFDSDFQPPLADAGTAPTDQLHAASLQLMSLWEDIYLGLYSARAIRSSAEQRRDQVRALNRVCDEWEQQHRVLLKSSSSMTTLGVSLMQMEAKYCYHVSKVLANRCDVSADGWQTTRDHALSALRSVTDVVKEPVSPGSCLVLRRMFQNYPLVAFHDLCVRLLTGRGEDDSPSTVPLLDNVRQHLGALRRPDFPGAYAAKLYQGLSWCTDLMRMVQDGAAYSHSALSLMTPSSTDQAGGCDMLTSDVRGLASSCAGLGDTMQQDMVEAYETFDSSDYYFASELFESLLSGT